MKKFLIILLLFSSFLAQAQTTYYVAASGGDNGNPGTEGSPWATLAYAVTQVSAGDIIYMNSGTHTINTTVEIPIGVSLRGSGPTSIITSASLTAEWTPIIDMRSESLVDGDQTISHLKFDGSSLQAAQALWIERRNNIDIHNCTFIDFKYTGIIWVGDGGYAGGDPYENAYPPDNYVTGSKFYNNIVTNCARNVPWDWGRGALYIGGHEGMLLYNNIITQTQREDGYNGYPIKAFANGGWMKGWKVFNNTITKVDYGSGSWMFAIEGAFYEGCEFYNNTITGAIDINFADKGNYDYGVYIHDNTLGPEMTSSIYYVGVILEFGIEDVNIERNHFRYCAMGIHHTMRYPEPWVKRVKVHYNKFSNLGSGSYHSAIRFGETQYDFDIQDYEIYNNVFHANPSLRPYFGLHIRGFNTATNIKIRNNIFLNFGWSWFESNRGDYFDTLYVQNNMLYNNANSNSTNLNGTPTNYTNSDNKIADPDFFSESNFRLNSGSPAIGAGKYIPELKYDLDGIQVENPPNIGCYETIADLASPSYVSSVIEDSVPDLLIISYDMLLAQIIPDKGSFEVKSNSQLLPISSITIIEGKVHITLDSSVSYGDLITLSYNIPSTGPSLQSVFNVNAAAITNSIVTNNIVTNIVKLEGPGSSLFLTLDIYPNPVKDSFTINIEGDVPESANVFRISDGNGSVIFNIPFTTEMLGSVINVNLNPGLYIAQILSEDKILGVCKIVVIK